MSNNLFIKKIFYVFKEEGIFILFRRIIRYITYLFKRNIFHNKSDFNKWKNIESLYNNKRAFIIGNGPSLNKTPLYLLENEFTICFNRFDLMLERLGWKPSAYSIIDDVVLADIPDIAYKMTKECEYAFFPSFHPSAPVNLNFKKIIRNNENIYWLDLGDIGFSKELPRCGINKTVANVALQVLVYMGFEEIYFIGVDLDYKIPDSIIENNGRDLVASEDDDPNHFDPRYFGAGSKYHYPRMDETFEKFDEAAIFLKNNNVKGFNAGIGGKLESFERVNFKDLFTYSKKEELELMLSKFIDKVTSENLQDIFQSALSITSEEEWDDNYNEIICNEEIGFELIPKKVVEFIPLGPFYGNYIFLNKKIYN